MKLKTTFSIIVSLTVLQIAFMALIMLFNMRRMQEMKNFQVVQTDTKVQLGGVLNYLSDLQLRGFNVGSAFNEWEQKVFGLDKNFDYLLNSKISLSFGPKFREQIDSVSTLWTLLKERFLPMEEIFRQMQGVKFPTNTEKTSVEKFGIRYFARDSNSDAARLLENLLDEIEPHIDGIYRIYTTMSRLNLQNDYIIADVLEKAWRQTLIVTIIIAVLSGLILAILIILVTNRITKRIVTIQNLTGSLAKKDFTGSLEPSGNTEIASLMENVNVMVQEIRDFFVVVKNASTKAVSSGFMIAYNVSDATDKIDINLDATNREFEKVTESVKKAILALSDMNAQIETLVNNNIKQTTAIVSTNESVEQAVQTLCYMNDLVSKRAFVVSEMQGLFEDSDSKITSTAKVLAAITAELSEVRGIVTIIDSIAKKTNLLSINASIEAAHSGAAGSGFAVVANEIRNLADETSRNSSRIQEVVQHVVDSVNTANFSSLEVSDSFAKVKAQSDEIISAFKELTSSIGDIDSSMKLIHDQSRETVSISNDMSGYCKGLSEHQKQVSSQVDEMTELVSHTLYSIQQIKQGTADVAKKMRGVREDSEKSYANMTKLEDVMKEFKTTAEVDDIFDDIIIEDIGTEDVVTD